MKEKKLSGKLLLLLAAFYVIAYLASLLYSKPVFFDADSYYHIAFSAFIKDFGLRHPFPWLQFSILKDNFADKDVFFHLLIVPFLTLFKNPVAAGKLALIFFNLLLVAAYIFVLKKYLSAKLTALLLVLPLLSPIFTIYCLQLRSIHLAAVLGILIIYFLINKKPVLVLILAFLYTLSHLSFILLVFMAVGAEILRYLYRKEFFTRNIASIIAGIALGILLHPNFPHNLMVIFLNGIATPLLAFNGNDIGFAGELLPQDTKHALLYNPAIFLSLFLVAWIIFFKRRRIAMDTSIWLVCAGVYLALALRANRYWYEANLYYFIFLGAFIAELKLTKGLKIAAAAFFAIVIIFSLQNRAVLHEHMERYGQRSVYLEDIAQWMNKNLPAGKIIYHSAWDTSHYFLCFNPKDYYINGFDPIYMYWRHRKELQLLDDLSLGRVGNPKTAINKIFKAEYGFVGISEPLYREIKNTPADFKILYNNPEGMIFQVIPSRTS